MARARARAPRRQIRANLLHELVPLCDEEGARRVGVGVEARVEREHVAVLALQREARQGGEQRAEGGDVLVLGRGVQRGVGSGHHRAVGDARVDEQRRVANDDVGLGLAHDRAERRAEAAVQQGMRRVVDRQR